MEADNHKIIIGDLFPNPPGQDGGVYLNCQGGIKYPVAIIIRSANAEVVFKAAHILPASGGIIFMDLSKLSPGEYEVTIVCGHHVSLQQLHIKHRPKGNIFQKWFKN